ncbi:MAG: hypothetical protein ABIE75_04010 [Candidatus Omnitrophota bacterium]
MPRKAIGSIMERGIFLNKNIEFDDPIDYDCAYLGDEFCEQYLPSAASVDRAVNFCRRYSKKLTLVTPFLTNQGMTRLIKLIDFIDVNNINAEIVINDWGLLKLLNKRASSFQRVLGRILVSRYLSKFHYNEAMRHFSSNKRRRFYCLFPEQFLDLLKAEKIFRLEFNSLNQLATTHLQIKERGFKAHIYHPFMYITTSRYCNVAGGHDRSRYYSPTCTCSEECRESFAVKYNRYFKRKIFTKGNAYFIKQTQDPGKLCFSIDRVVGNNFIER